MGDSLKWVKSRRRRRRKRERKRERKTEQWWKQWPSYAWRTQARMAHASRLGQKKEWMMVITMAKLRMAHAWPTQAAWANSESRKTQRWCYGVPNIVVFSGLYKAKCKNKIELFDIQNRRLSNHVKRYARYKFWSPKSKQQTKPWIGSIWFLYMRIYSASVLIGFKNYTEDQNLTFIIIICPWYCCWTFSEFFSVAKFCFCCHFYALRATELRFYIWKI